MQVTVELVLVLECDALKLLPKEVNRLVGLATIRGKTVYLALRLSI